jgi:hypothetical protein
MAVSKRRTRKSGDWTRALGKITTYLAEPAGKKTSATPTVDLPRFVSQLIAGVFQAAVDASIEQLEAYAALVNDVAKSVDAFGKDHVSAQRAEDRLIAKYGALLAPSRPARTLRGGLARQRQQLVATMVLMGINRIVVTDGKINAGLPKRAPKRPKKR